MKNKEFKIKILSAILIFTLAFITILDSAKANAAERDMTSVAQVAGEVLKSEAQKNAKIIKEAKRELGFVALDSPIGTETQRIIYETAKKYKIGYELVVALVETESGGNCKRVSATDDYGLMQINQCNHTWLRDKLNIEDFLNPEDNTKAGCYLLSSLLKRYDGNKSMALMAYNMGEGNASKYWDEGIYQSGYSKKILEREKELCSQEK